jgi:chemotaxis protein MotB
MKTSKTRTPMLPIFILIALLFSGIIGNIFSEEATKEVTFPKPEEITLQVNESWFFYWKSEYNELVQKWKDLHAKYKALYYSGKTEQSTLNNTVQDTQSRSATNDADLIQAKQDLGKAEAEKQANQQTIERLTKEVTTITTEREKLIKEYYLVKQDAEKKTANEKQLKDRIATLEKEIETLKAAPKNTTTAAPDPKIKQLEAEKAELQKQLAAAKSAPAPVNNTAALDQKIKQLEADKADLQKQIALAKAAPAPVKPTPAPVAPVTNPADQAKITSLEQKIKQLETDKADLAKQVTAAKSTPAPAPVNNTAPLEQKIKQLEAEKAELQKQLTAAKSAPVPAPVVTPVAPATNSADQAKITSLEQKVKQLETEKADLAKQVTTAKSTPAPVVPVTPPANNEQAKALEAKIANLEQRLKEAEAVKALAEQKASQVDSAKAQAEEKIKAFTEKEAALKKELADALDQIEKSKKENEEQTAELKKQIESLEKEMEAMRGDNEALLSDLASMKDKFTEESVKHKEEVEKLANQTTKLEEALEQEIKKGQTSITQKNGRIIINLANSITFDSGSAVLKKSGKKTIAKIYNVLKKYPKNLIYIEGNTDDVPVASGRFRDNWELSSERALAVLRYLVDHKKANPKKVAAAGFGEYNPVKPNNSSKNRSLNRRVEIVVMPGRAK